MKVVHQAPGGGLVVGRPIARPVILRGPWMIGGFFWIEDASGRTVVDRVAYRDDAEEIVGALNRGTPT